MNILATLTMVDWASLAIVLLILLVWGLEKLAEHRQIAPEPPAPTLSLSSGATWQASTLSDNAQHQRSNQPVQVLLYPHSEFIGPDAAAIAGQLLDPGAPYDGIQGSLTADLLALADMDYATPPAATLDPAAMPIHHVLQPEAPWLDESLQPLSPRLRQFMRLFVAMLALAPLFYRLLFP